jgi:hypothetical protein
LEHHYTRFTAKVYPPGIKKLAVVEATAQPNVNYFRSNRKAASKSTSAVKKNPVKKIKPWLHKASGLWCIKRKGKRYYLGRTESESIERYGMFSQRIERRHRPK